MKDNVIILASRQPSLRMMSDWSVTEEKKPTYAPSFVDLGEFCGYACLLTLTWVKRNGGTDEFPRSVRDALEKWGRESIRGLSHIYVSTNGFASIEAADDWATFRYEVTLSPDWLKAGYGDLK